MGVIYRLTDDLWKISFLTIFTILHWIPAPSCGGTSQWTLQLPPPPLVDPNPSPLHEPQQPKEGK